MVKHAYGRCPTRRQLSTRPLVTGHIWRRNTPQTVRAQARFRRQIGVLHSTVAVYIASNGGNDEEDCWVVSSFCKICNQGIVTSFSEDDSGEAVLDLFAELCFERFTKQRDCFRSFSWTSSSTKKLMDRTFLPIVLFLGELSEIGDPQHVGRSSVDT